MALSPLCHQERPPHDVVGHAAQAITAHTADAVERADLLATLAVFGKLVYPGFDVVNLIGRELMKESKVIEEFQQEARVETRREDILRVLEAKFGRRAAGEFASFLKTVTQIAQLNRLLRLAARSEGIQQFRDRLPEI